MSQTKKVTKAVIAAAGFGTRFLPQTKAMPKEMLPLIDKPIIQHVVEELVAVGVKDIIIVTGYSKRAIEDHFDRPSEDLITNLKMGGPKKAHLLETIEAISELANFVYVRQKGPYGNGTPLINAQHLVGDEPFFFTYSDDFIEATPLRFQQMIDAYNKYQSPILSTIRVSDDADYNRYGIAGGIKLDDNCIDITEITEKPGKDKAPSDLATVSGFLLTPGIFPYLNSQLSILEPGDELYANDALKLMLKDSKRLVACEITNSKFHDTGDKLEYLKTVFDYAIRDKELGDSLKEYLRTLL